MVGQTLVIDMIKNISYMTFAATLQASVLCIVHPIPSRGIPADAGRTGLAVFPVDEAAALPNRKTNI
jgi:hypothetical protein